MIKRKGGVDLRDYIGRWVNLQYAGGEKDTAKVTKIDENVCGIKTAIEVYHYTHKGTWITSNDV